MRGFIRFRDAVAVLALSAGLVGCGSDDPLGGMGGQIFGDMASKQAGNMMAGDAQKKAQKQQQAAAQQQQAQQAAGLTYQAPSMEMTGTLTEKKGADGTAGGWSFTEQQSAIGTAVDVSAVEKDARKLAGKKVKITGRYNTLGTGAFVVDSVAAAAEQ